jgi:predicted transposase YdaD
MQEIDHVFKTVLTRKPNIFLDLLFGRKRKTKLKEVADSQINIPELRADKALVVEDKGEIHHLICEAMLQPRRKKLLNFALKAFGNQYLFKKPTVLVIVYLAKGKYASFPEGFENRIGGLLTQFQCATIKLWEHEARILSGELKEFAPFLPLFYKRPDRRLIKFQKKLLAQTIDPELYADLTAATILIDIRAFGAEIVLAEFTKKELRMLKDTSFVQDWLTESRQKGKLEGKLEGKLSVIEIILQQKLGALSPRLRSQLQKLDNKKLDRLTVKLQQITSQKDLQTWLKNGASRHPSR